MFWAVKCERVEPEMAASVESAGRFVLHRHNDEGGRHLDLRLECGECLMGWRIDGVALEGEPWAIEKAPHPLFWLDTDGDALREDEGTYAWVTRDDRHVSVLLKGREHVRVISAEPVTSISVDAVRSICAALETHSVKVQDAAGLIEDGVVARQRALARFCGLGRELDGAAFDEALWRKTLAGLSLENIQTYLRAYEVRFDAKYPPAPVSRPEPLPEEDGNTERAREEAALALMRE